MIYTIKVSEDRRSQAVTRSEEILELAERIKPILAGKDPHIQEAVLAELLSIWLAGHVVAGNEELTIVLHSELLAMHTRLVRKLAVINAGIMARKS